ncbi:MAG: methyltransferase domain-containing protein [Clostridiaceae bacterium]|nr:methyltransferase domain-containing protein [Clostridiaceae bacterium]
MEADFTLNQVNCFDTAPTDTVLDIGCGPGRITMAMAQRAKSVTSIDSSPKMLEFCEQNVHELGLTNVTTKLLDWQEAQVGKNLDKHDIVICSRTAGLNEILKLSSFARKYVVTIVWSHGYPSIPTITGYLFEGVQLPKNQAIPASPFRSDRRFGDNLTYNMVYDLGYNPNLQVVEDGFKKDYTSREEAYADLRRLRPEMGDDQMPVFSGNVDKFLIENKQGGVTYLSKTRTMVMWWSPKLEG